MNLQLPPLRERGEDIVIMANAFLRRNCKEQRRKLRFAGSAIEAMTHYSWPGNIRELENAGARATIMPKTKLIEARDLRIEIGESPDPASLRGARDPIEREALLDALVKTRGNISRSRQPEAPYRPTANAPGRVMGSPSRSHSWPGVGTR